MAGYIRQSTFVDGDTITAALFNNEYNQLVNAFSNTSGHKHDGTTAEGPVIGLIGDAGETSPNNKVLIDTTNNHIEFYVEVSSNPVQQIYIADGAIVPVTDNDIDLGTSSLEFKNIYIDGTATIDTLTVDEAATVGTTLGVTGATTLSSTLAVTGTSTLTGNVTATNDLSVGGNLTVTGNATISGNLTFGDADTDSINLAAEIDSHIVPNTDDTYDLGTSTKQWRNLYIDGTAEIDTLAIDGTTVTSTAAELNILDGVTSTAAELNILDGVTATAAEINTLDGITSTVAELNILDGVTASATDINLIDGITNGTVIASKAIVTDANKDISGGRNITITGELDAATLDISGNADIDGTLETDALSINGTTVTSTAAELNILDGVTSTAAELNILDGVTSTTAELNILDGVTATTAELNILDGVTSTAAELNILDGKAFLDEDDMSSNSATGIASQQSIKAYVDATVAATNEVVEDSTPQLGGTLDTNGNLIQFGDSSGATDDRLQFGASQDLQIYHDGINSYIVNTTNDLIIGEDTRVRIKTPSLLVNNAADTENMLTATENGAVTLFYDNSAKLATTSTGVDVTGTVTSDGLTMASGSQATIGVFGTSGLQLIGQTGSDNIVGTIGASEPLIFRTAAVERARFDTSGNFGIGTGSPNAYSNQTTLTINGATYGRLDIESSNTLRASLFATSGSASLTTSTDVLSFDTSGGEAMRINASGNVGIGTSSPAAPLHVKGASNQIRIQDSTNDKKYDLNVDGDKFFIDDSTAGVNVFTISSTNVGIGTTNPVDKLQISTSGSGNPYIGFDHTGDNPYMEMQRWSGSSSNYFGTRIKSYQGVLAFETTGSSPAAVGSQTFSESMRIDDSGKVSIGTTSTTAPLRVKVATDANFAVQNTSSTVQLQGINDAANAFTTIDIAGNPIKFSGNGSESMRINSGGDLLLGTTSGTAIKLNVQSSKANGLAAHLVNTESSTGSGIVVNGGSSSSNYSADFRDYNNTNLMRLTGEGKLGIGTTSPQDTIHVVTDSSTTNDTVDVARIEATSSGTPAVGFGPTIDFRGERAGASSDSMGRIGFVADTMTSSRIDGAYVVETAIDGTYSERMRITSAGNVGIGQTSPSAKLHVTLEGTVPTIASETVAVFNRNGGVSHEANISIIGGATGASVIHFGDNDEDIGRIRYQHASGDADHMAFYVAGSEKTRINSSGSLSLGTAIGNSTYAGLFNGVSNVGTGAIIQTRNGDGNKHFMLRGDNNVEYGSIGLSSASGTAALQLQGESFITFNTNTNTERMRIDGSGNLLVGTTSTTSIATHSPNIVTSTQLGSVSGSNKATFGVDRIYFDSSNYYVLNASAVGVKLVNGATSWTTQSDENLKENIVELKGALEKVKDYRCVEYNLIADEAKSKKIGFIAQDWQKDYDQIIDKDDDDNLGIRYTETIPVLLKAIQEQQAQIEALQSEINELKNS